MRRTAPEYGEERARKGRSPQLPRVPERGGRLVARGMAAVAAASLRFVYAVPFSRPCRLAPQGTVCLLPPARLSGRSSAAS